MADDLYKRLTEDQQSFWAAVYPLYIQREITRDTVREVVRRGLEQARGNYRIVAKLFNTIPTGVGASQAIKKLSTRELRQLMSKGATWAFERGFHAAHDDAAHAEEGGCLRGADPEAVSDRALERGAEQVGTLGGGDAEPVLTGPRLEHRRRDVTESVLYDAANTWLVVDDEHTSLFRLELLGVR